MSKSGREYFRLGAESYGRVGKKGEENTRVHFWTFSPVHNVRVFACILYLSLALTSKAKFHLSPIRKVLV